MKKKNINIRSRITVPFPTDNFQGRKKAMVEILELIDKNKITAITGPPGQGKSEVVRAVAHFLADRKKYPKGIFWASDRKREYEYPLKNLETLCNVFLKGKGVSNVEKIHLEDKKNKVLSILSSGQALLVLDNFDTLKGNQKQEIDDFLQRLSQDARVLITTRHNLYPTLARRYQLKQLEQDDAVILFERLLNRVGYFDDIKKTAEDRDCIEKICHTLKGHPLSLVLVAGHASETSPIKDIASELKEKPKNILKNINPTPGTPTPLWKSLDLSLSQLTPAIRELFLKLSIFFVPFSSEAAEAVLVKNNLKPLLDILVQRNLLEYIEMERYFFKQILKDVAIDLLKIFRWSEENLYRKAADYFKKQKAPESAQALNHLEWLYNRGDEKAGREMVDFMLDIEQSLYKSGRWSLDEEYFKKSLTVAKKIAYLKGGAELLNRRGCLSRHKGNLNDAINMHEDSIKILKKLENRKEREEEIANQLGCLGLVYRDLGNLKKAKEVLKEALAIHECLNSHCQARAFGCLGLVYRDLGEHKKAEDYFNKALNIFKKENDLSGQADIWGYMGVLYRYQGKLKEAEQAHNKAKGMHGNNLPGHAYNYGSLGVVYLCQGNLDKAEKVLKIALDIDKKITSLPGQASQLKRLGMVYKNQGKFCEAKQTLYDALELYKQTNNLRGQACVWSNLGLVYKYLKNFEKSVEVLNNAFFIDQQINNLRGQSWTWGNKARLFEEYRELEEVEQLHKKALSINRQINNLRGQAWTYNSMGTIYMKQERLADAKEAYKEALKLSSDNCLNHLPGQAWSCYNLGLVYRYKKEFDEAEKILKRALNINKQLDHYLGQAKNCCNLALVYERKGQSFKDQAIVYTNLAKDAFRGLGYIQNVKSLGQICTACKARWDFDDICRT